MMVENKKIKKEILKVKKEIEVALIAHDGKKTEMAVFVQDHLRVFKKSNVKVISTGTTGKHVEHAGIKVKRFLSGPIGGDAEIAARVAQKKTDMVIFFRDPLGRHPHEPDIAMLMRLCDVHNTPLATNVATASIMIRSLIGRR